MRRIAIMAATMLCLVPSGLRAQPHFQLDSIPTPAQTDAIALYPAGALPVGQSPERWGRLTAQLDPATHLDGRIVRNVSIPTITPVLPAADKAIGAAVLIAPGGAFLSLSMDSEGYAAAQRLADRGIAAFILKYRTNTVPDDEVAFMQTVGRVMGEAARPGGTQSITDPAAPADALQALRLIRKRAAEWHVDPGRIGMMGFSAGAMIMALARDGPAQPRPWSCPNSKTGSRARGLLVRKP